MDASPRKPLYRTFARRTLSIPMIHHPASPHASLMPVRFRILFVLVLVSLVNYLLRNNLSYVLPSIRAEFHFTSTELGWIVGAFNYSYTLFQVPSGALGDAYGPRRVLAIAAIGWGLLTA